MPDGGKKAKDKAQKNKDAKKSKGSGSPPKDKK